MMPRDHKFALFMIILQIQFDLSAEKGQDKLKVPGDKIYFSLYQAFMKINIWCKASSPVSL